MRYSADLNDRALYRRALHRVAEAGFRPFQDFLFKHQDLFAPEEWSRVLRMLDLHGSNLPRLTAHKFRSYRGEIHDPAIDNAAYPTVIETIITPHKFLRHALGLVGGA